MSCPREIRENAEKILVGPYGVLSADSRGRLHEDEPCQIRTCFQRDIDRITHSKSFRRLKHKTQVFLQPEGDHYRTRLTHTLEVSRIARTAAGALQLNEDLTEAIALGHDLGHTPFGHAGERALRELMPGGFQHYEQSLRVVDRIEITEKGGYLNFTYHGTGFLQYMVRILTGTLLEVGFGEREPAGIPALIEARDRAQAGPTAPPQGLCLIKVDYS